MQFYSRLFTFFVDMVRFALCSSSTDISRCAAAICSSLKNDSVFFIIFEWSLGSVFVSYAYHRYQGWSSLAGISTPISRPSVGVVVAGIVVVRVVVAGVVVVRVVVAGVVVAGVVVVGVVVVGVVVAGVVVAGVAVAGVVVAGVVVVGVVVAGVVVAGVVVIGVVVVGVVAVVSHIVPISPG